MVPLKTPNMQAPIPKPPLAALALGSFLAGAVIINEITSHFHMSDNKRSTAYTQFQHDVTRSMLNDADRMNKHLAYENNALKQIIATPNLNICEVQSRLATIEKEKRTNMEFMERRVARESEDRDRQLRDLSHRFG